MHGVVDSDTHIAESEAMWKMMDADMRGRRPVLLTMPEDTLYGGWNATWLIDGNIFPKPVGKGGFRLITPSASKIQANRKDIGVGCREMTDIPARLADMDRLGIETHRSSIRRSSWFILPKIRSSTLRWRGPTTASWPTPARRAAVAFVGSWCRR